MSTYTMLVRTMARATRARTRPGIACAALFCLFAAAAQAQTFGNMDAQDARLGVCMATGYDCPNGGVQQHSQMAFDPCFIAQNAMRPCAPEQQAKKPAGVDPNLVGTWELPFKDQTWVWEILREGTYKFQIRGKDGSPSNTGSFSAGNGSWSLSTPAGYSDSGKYFFQAPDTWVATGNLGVGAWRHPAAMKNAARACTSGEDPAQSAAGVDPKVVGVWELPLKGGRWIWEIVRDGTYKFRSEAGDNAPSHSGKLSAGNEHWSMTATTMAYSDAGLYLYQAPDILIATGQQGAAAWRRVPSSACP